MQNHIVKSFGPGGEFTRHSEGAFLRMKDGGIYFAYSRFTGSGNDAAPSNHYCSSCCHCDCCGKIYL